MNITQALRKLDFKKQAWFKYKFPDAKIDKGLRFNSAEEVLKRTGKKTIYSFLEWEQTDEYKMLVDLYLKQKATKDLIEIYNVVSEQAKKGDDKSIKLFLMLKKEIENNTKNADKIFGKKNEEQTEPEEEEDDGLILD